MVQLHDDHDWDKPGDRTKQRSYIENEALVIGELHDCCNERGEDLHNAATPVELVEPLGTIAVRIAKEQEFEDYPRDQNREQVLKH